jgi:WD40 repeat protein
MTMDDEPRRSPYVGLVPYTEEDAAWFFGREHEETIITANLRGSRLTLLYGASGVGKSSLLGAGIVPKLRALVRANREIPVTATRGVLAPERVPLAVVVFREWRDPPLAPFMETIRAGVADATGDDDLQAWEHGRPVLASLHAWTQRVRTVLVIFDQFEEYFLYHRRERGPGTFAGEFPSIVNEPDLRLNVLISLREDAWSQLDRFKGTIPNLFANYVRVPYLDREAGRRAITGPIDEYNRRLAPGESPVTIEPDLVERVLDEVPTGRLTLGGEAGVPLADDAGDDRIETPFLQLVMEQLWSAATADGGRVLDCAALDRLGGAKAIVSGHLDEAMRALGPEDVAVAAELMRYLVTPARTKVSHDVATLTEWTKLRREDVARVLEELAGPRRILRVVPSPDDDPGNNRYEIFHDVLGQSILEWRRGYEQEREKAALAAELEADQRERRALEIARNRKRLRRIAVLLAGALLVVGVVIGVLLYAHNQQVAHGAALAATAETQMGIDPELSVLLSERSIKHNDTPAGRAILRESLSASRVRGALRGGRAPACPDCGLEPPSQPALIAAPVAISPDGRQLAAATAGNVSVWTPQTGTTHRAAVGNATIIAFSPSGRRLLAAGIDGLWLLDADGANPLRIRRDEMSSAAFSPDGRWIVAAAPNRGSVAVYRATDGHPRAAMSAQANALDFSPDGATVLVSTVEGVLLWHWRGGRSDVLEPLGGKRPTAASPFLFIAAFSADGRRVAVGRADGRAGIYDVASSRRIVRIPTTPRPVSAAVFSPDGRFLLTTADKDANLWDSRSGDLIAALRGHAARITSATFSADGTLLATASEDGTIRIWDTGANAPVMILRGHGAAVTGVAFSGGDRMLVSTGNDGTVRVWDVGTGRVLRGRNWILDAAFDDDGRFVATAGADHVVRLWKPGDVDAAVLFRDRKKTMFNGIAFRHGTVLVGGERPNQKGNVRAIDADAGRVLWARRLDGGVAQVAMSGDGRRGLSVSRDGRAFLWNMATGASQLLYADRTQSPLSDGALSDDGRLALVAGSRGRALVFDVNSRKLVAVHVQPQSAGEEVLAGAFSPSHKLAVTSEGQNIAVWDTTDGRTKLLLTGHEGPVGAVAFSPDGKRIVSGGADRSIRVWDASNGAILAVLRDHSDYVNSVSFSPDGRSILSASDDFTTKVTTCDTCGGLDDLLRLASERVTRSLTGAQEDRLIRGHR